MLPLFIDAALVGLFLLFFLVFVLLVVVRKRAHGQEGNSQQNGRKLFHWYSKLLGNWRSIVLPLNILIVRRVRDFRIFRVSPEKYRDQSVVVIGTNGPGTGFPVTSLPGKLFAGASCLQDIFLVFRYTRRWIQFGIISHAVICIFIAAVEQTLR